MPKISRSKLAEQTWNALKQAFPDSACSLDFDLPETFRKFIPKKGKCQWDAGTFVR